MTSKDVAERLGVTTATVSYVMNGKKGVSEDVAEKVRKVARELGYEPNRIARATRTGRSNTLAIMLPDLSNPFFPLLAQGAQRAAHEAGYALFLFDAHNDQSTEEESLERIRSYAVDGILWCPTSDRAVIDQELGRPTVIIDRPIQGFDSVFADAQAGGALQGKYALEMGHRRFGLLSGPTRSPSAITRREGFLSELGNKGELLWEFQLEYTNHVPDNAIERAIQGDATCVVCANDSIAIGFIGRLRERGISVPDDISVIGYDNIDWSALVAPGLTTVGLPISELGEAATRLVLERLESPQQQFKDIKLGVELIERGSVQRLK